MGKQSVFCKKNHQRLFDVREGSRLIIRIKCSNNRCKCKTTCAKKEIIRVGNSQGVLWPVEYIPYKCPICGHRLFDASLDSCGRAVIKCNRCRNVVDILIGDINESAYAA